MSSSHRALIAGVCALLEDWTGFDLRETTPQRIAEALTQRAASLGYADPAEYLQSLQRLRPTDEEPQLLVNLITNGLTAFWRDEPQLSALRSILRHLHEARSTSAPVHIWCAGVSTGEEAYTAAMIAHEEALPVHVLGTDINTDFLRSAREGIYSKWSLRRLSDERRDRFLRAVDRHHFQIDHPAFQAVSFLHHNLLDPPPPSLASDRRWDLVLCRNVLIYFSPAATSRALRNMASSLSEEGYLLFGSSEQVHPDRLGPDAPELRPLRQGAGFVYRPGSGRTGRTIEPGRLILSEEHHEPQVPQFQREIGLEETTSDAGQAQIVTDLLRSGADHLQGGGLDEALACFEACLGYDPFHVECHCLMGSLLQALGDPRRSLDAFQKALFLSPRHWFAAHRAATLHTQRGDPDAARLAHRRALQGLDAQEDPLDSSHVLRELLSPLEPLRSLARRQAEELFSSPRK